MKTIIKEPSYETRCPRCAAHFAFELEDFIANGGYGSNRYVECPNCKNNIRIIDSDTEALLPIVKVSYNGRIHKPVITISDFAFTEDEYEDVSYWSESNTYNGEEYISYCFELKLKDKDPIHFDTCDKSTAEDWAKRLGVDIYSYRAEVSDPITVIASKEVEHIEE